MPLPLASIMRQWSVMHVLVLLLLPSYRQVRRHCCQCHPHHCHPHAIFLFAKTSRLGLLMSSCWLRHSLAADCFCLAEICRLATLFKTRCSTVINLHKLVHTLRTCKALKPSYHEVVRARQWIQKFTQHSAANAQHQQQTMVTKRERRYNR